MPTLPTDTPTTAPWETKNLSSGKHFSRRLLQWLGGFFLLGLVTWGLLPKPIVIETEKVTRGTITVRVSEEGKTRVRNRYIVAAPVIGKMRRVLLKPGDEVTAGETILTTIDPIPAPLLDFRARAQAEAIVSMHEASRKQASASLEAKQSSLQMAEADRNRVRAVTREGSVSATDRDRAEGDALMRAAEVRAAEFSLQVIDYELAQARAALERPQNLTSGNLVDVKSPVSGRVLKAEILSRDAVAIQAGDSVEIEQWGGEKPIMGRVRRVEPAAFTKISALGVEEQRVIVLSDLVDAPAAAKSLGDRFRVEARVAVWHGENLLVVASGALFREGNEWKTYVLQNGAAKLTHVVVGHSDGRMTEILSGLAVGDEVLLHPPDTVSDGRAVQKRQN